MITENVHALVAYRLEQADECLDAAKVLLEKKLHRGAISLFDKEFVKPGTFSKDFSRWLHDAFDLRQRSDYTVEFHVTGDEAGMIFEHAVSFVGEVKTVLAKLVDNPDPSSL